MDKQMKYLIGLMAMGLMLVCPVISHATPGARVLITDNPGHRVFEIDPLTYEVVWSYGTGVPGSGPGQLNYPNEAIPLTNGNIMIADTYNGRVIEVDSATQNIVWQYTGDHGPFTPVDIKRCKDYSSGSPAQPPQDTLLITDLSQGNRVIEITYPGKTLVWNFQTPTEGGGGKYIFWEAEKRPGLGTPTYLITCRSNKGNNDSVIEVERTGQNSGTIIAQYTELNDPRDANWLGPQIALITDTDNKRVIAVDYASGDIEWQWGPYSESQRGTFTPYEAIQIENGGFLIAGAFGNVDDNKDGRYAIGPLTSILEVGLDGTITWRYDQGHSTFVDVEEKGIINLAHIQYKERNEKDPPVFAGVVVPIYQPKIVWVGTPTIVATKTVSPTGPQRPGATLTYTIALANTGPGTATDVMVIDRIPEGTVYIPGSTWAAGFSNVTTQWSHDGGLTYDNSEVLPVTHVGWQIPSMAPGESGTLKFSVKIE